VIALNFTAQRKLQTITGVAFDYLCGEGLITGFFSTLFTEKYGDFIEANRTEDSVERLKELKRLVSEVSDMRHVHLNIIKLSLQSIQQILFFFFVISCRY